MRTETKRNGRPAPAQLGKAGGVVDRRFGENDPEMDPEARALARMARLRSAQLGSGRRSAFDLAGAPFPPRPPSSPAYPCSPCYNPPPNPRLPPLPRPLRVCTHAPATRARCCASPRRAAAGRGGGC